MSKKWAMAAALVLGIAAAGSAQAGGHWRGYYGGCGPRGFCAPAPCLPRPYCAPRFCPPPVCGPRFCPPPAPVCGPALYGPGFGFSYSNYGYGQPGFGLNFSIGR